MPTQIKPKILELSIVPIKSFGGTIQAFANFLLVFGSYQLYLGGVAIHSDAPRRSFRLTYPTRKLQNGQEIPIFHPVGKELGEILETEIVSAWERLIQ